MGFRAINEIEKFSFEDCQISRFELCENMIKLELEALIVKADNSQNFNYTESYAGTTQVRLENGRLLSGYKEGYRYYDANDVLIREMPDEKLSASELTELVKRCKGAYLFFMAEKETRKDEAIYVAGIEFVSEEAYDTTVTDSYRLEISFTDAIFEWERYMNRVQR